MKKKLLIAIICLSSTGLATEVAQADPMTGPNQNDSDWRFTGAVYAFAPFRTTGTTTVSGVSAPIDLDLGEVLDNLDFAASGRFEAWKGDWGVIFDANYYSISADGSLPGPAGGSVDVNVRQEWLGVLAAYRIANGTYGTSGKRYTVDVQAGYRYNSLRQEVDIATPGPATTLGGDDSWWEPVIGARGKWELNNQWATVASLEFGGFGAGGNDLQVGLNAGFDYHPWDNTSIIFGYRYFSMDYSTTLESGAFAYDVEQHGPYIGVKYVFQ
ncbi:hypothetical protein C1J03_05425 [Sulfitobacter sp. SK012]|uniref:outer membrane protein n=1 Tax=Sulfitobacter sp. SK012 TaxID=1389005 RepID=UPI000E0BC6FF|nr:hypothetical protein [Sulfitobacter sp. SK012]AXI45523.1 hypothetical protein C1J03_05425 [Sulfitobacter sp. SK012]